MASQRARYAGNSVQCNKFHHGNVVLLGDAAHGMLATYGQGANAAMESAVQLARSIAAAGPDPQAAAAHFSAARLPDARAIVDMSRQAMRGTRVGISVLHWLEFLLLQAQHLVAPNLLAPPPLLVMSDTTAPYRQVRDATNVAKTTLYCMLGSLAWMAALGGQAAVGAMP